MCCLNVQCNAYGQRGQANLKVRKIYGVDRIRYLRCGCCGEEFSERKGTALFNCKISEAQAVSVMEHLDSGCGLNVTARLVGVSKDAVGRLLRVGGRVSYQLHDRLVRNLQPVALQFDEKWSYVAKKQRHVTAQDDPSQTGDYWDANSLDPQSKLLVSLVPGCRTTHTIHQVVADAAQRLACDAGLPALFTDGEPTYPEAIVTTFGRAYPVPRRSPRGRPPAPVVRIPQGLVYAQVVKHRQGRRVQQVEVRPIFGKGKLAQVVADLGWTKANTSAIERFNLTDRMRNARKGAKLCAFRVGRIGMMPSVGLELCATIFIIRIDPCDSGRTRRPMATEESGDGRRDRRSSLFLAGTHAALSGWTEIIANYDQKM